MGESSDDGVVDWRGQVFTGRGVDTHEGLYVWDASIIPASLGINPLLVISSLSDVLSDEALKAMKPQRSSIQEPLIRKRTLQLVSFKETMSGAVTLRENENEVPLTLNIQLVRDENVDGTTDAGISFDLTGTVEMQLEGRTVRRKVKGYASILSPDRHRQSLKMSYVLSWHDGDEYRLVGTKRVAKDIFNIWSSTTRMSVSVKRGGAEWARGEVALNLRNALRILKSMFLDEPSLDKTKSNLKFLGLFQERLWRNLP